jgi:hypothetical protein
MDSLLPIVFRFVGGVGNQLTIRIPLACSVIQVQSDAACALAIDGAHAYPAANSVVFDQAYVAILTAAGIVGCAYDLVENQNLVMSPAATASNCNVVAWIIATAPTGSGS